MRKRLRKKLRLAEFKQMGFEVRYRTDAGLTEAARDALLDSFILQAIEANDLSCGGGGGPEEWDFFVCANGRRSSTEADRERVRDWLERQPDIAQVLVGRLQDAWHDDEAAEREPLGRHAA
jgi:uncharacterized protein YggL (DUF469 family)